MKGLTLTQPWATAVAMGLKKWETRSWPTKYRGEVAIHAAKGYPGWARKFAAEPRWKGLLGALPVGAVVCVCEVTGCWRTEDLFGEIEMLDSERDWGNFSDGRWAFKLENLRLATVLNVRGALGFWGVGAELEARIREAVELSKEMAKNG